MEIATKHIERTVDIAWGWDDPGLPPLWATLGKEISRSVSAEDESLLIRLFVPDEDFDDLPPLLLGYAEESPSCMKVLDDLREDEEEICPACGTNRRYYARGLAGPEDTEDDWRGVCVAGCDFCGYYWSCRTTLEIHRLPLGEWIEKWKSQQV